MSNKNLLIAIDGPSSSGKGTVAKKVANHFNLPCLNTGGLYRAIAFLALENNLNLQQDETKIIPLCKNIADFDLESPNLHNEKIAAAASVVAVNPNIRQAIFDLQRNFATEGIKEKGGAVLEGRDIGTVICPDANYKFFITATPEVRAIRRFKQLQESSNQKNNFQTDDKQVSECLEYDEILNQLKERDKKDKSRAISPLKKADNSFEIDTSTMNIEEVVQEILRKINS